MSTDTAGCCLRVSPSWHVPPWAVIVPALPVPAPAWGLLEELAQRRQGRWGNGQGPPFRRTFPDPSSVGPANSRLGASDWLSLGLTPAIPPQQGRLGEWAWPFGPLQWEMALPCLKARGEQGVSPRCGKGSKMTKASVPSWPSLPDQGVDTVDTLRHLSPLQLMSSSSPPLEAECPESAACPSICISPSTLPSRCQLLKEPPGGGGDRQYRNDDGPAWHMPL